MRKAVMIFLFCSLPLNAFCLKIDNPEMIWRYSAGGRIYSSQAEGPDGTIYLISESRGVHALSPDNGLLKWIFRPGGKFLSFIVTSPDGTIFVASDRKELYAVNPGGTVRWVYHLKAAPVITPGVLPDGSLVVVFPDKKIQIISRKGILLKTLNMETLPVFPLLLFADQKIAWYSEDQTLKMMDFDGNKQLDVQLESINTVLIYRAKEQKFYLGSLEGLITSVGFDGKLETFRTPVSERIVFLLEHPKGLAVATADGSFWIMDDKGVFTLIGKGPNPGGCGAVTETGLCIYPSAGGGIIMVEGMNLKPLELETSVTPPLLTENGIMIFGGADWVLYGYKTQKNYSGWAQEGGNASRNGASSLTMVKEDDDVLYGNRGDYHYYRHLLDYGGIEDLWVIVNDIKKFRNREALEKKIPFYAIILKELCGIGTIYKKRNQIVPSKDSAIIRGEAYLILASLDDFRYRKLLLVSLAAENDPLALSFGFQALGSMGVDFDGSSMALISARTKGSPYLDDRLALSAVEALKEIKYYNGMITDQSAYMLMDYLIRAPKVSESARKKIFDIYRLMF